MANSWSGGAATFSRRVPSRAARATVRGYDGGIPAPRPHRMDTGKLERQYPMDATARARLLAVEVLLAEPELLGNDALETDLYILRDQLQEASPVRSR